jgi:outer membrane lipoprotein SlyB
MTKFTQEQIEHLGKRIEFLDAEDTEKGFSVMGSVGGYVRGGVGGSVMGRVEGSVRGTVEGDVWGDVKGSVWGRVEGDVEGDVWGDVRGNVLGDVGKKEAATNRLRRKLEILKLDAAKSRGQLFHDLQECLALMDIIEKER